MWVEAFGNVNFHTQLLVISYLTPSPNTSIKHKLAVVISIDEQHRLVMVYFEKEDHFI